MTLLQILFYSFELSLELSVTLGVLAFLLALQVYLFVKRINPKRSTTQQAASRAADVLKTLKTGSPKASTKKDSTIDSSVFSEFQKNVSRADKTTKPLGEADEKDVIVSLSSKAASKPKESAIPAKQKPKEPEQKPPIEQKLVQPSARKTAGIDSKTAKELAGKVKVDSIGGLFDDVQESLETEPVTNEIIEPDVDQTEDKKQRDPDQPILSNEFLTSKDLIADGEEAEGISLTLSVASEAFNKGKFEDSLAAIRQFLADNKDKPAGSEAMQSLVELKTENELALKQYDRAAKTLQSVFSKYITKSSPDFLPLLEKYIGKFVEAGEAPHAIHFMFTALNEYRQLQDHVKMDQIYEEIEEAYEQQEDWPRLIQTLQNHFSIKKVLKDFTGQLELLDHLGKLLYDQGEEDKSRKCYEQRLIVENEMAKASKRS